MNYDDLSREVLVARLEALEAERRAATGREGLVQELRTQQIELRMQNEALREAQLELEASRQRFSDLYTWAPVPFLTLDRLGRIVEANSAAAELLGLELGLLTGKALVVLARFEDPRTVSEHLEECVRRQMSVVSEMRFATSRGICEARFISAPVRSPLGPSDLILTAVIDVDATKRIERDLERARAAEANLRNRMERVASAHVAMTEAITRMDHLSPRGVLQVLADKAREVTGGAYAAVGVGMDETVAFDPWVVSGVASAAGDEVGRAPLPRGLLGEIVRSKTPVRLRDVRAHPSFDGLSFHLPEITSFLGVPLLHGGVSVGTLFVANRIGAEEFNEADELSAVMLSQPAAVVVAIAQMLGRERRRSALLRAMVPVVAKAVTQEATLEAVGRLAVSELGDVCAINLLDRAGALRVMAVHHVDAFTAATLTSLRGARSPLGESLVTDVLGGGHPRLFGRAPAGAKSLALGSTMLVPLHRDGEPIGLMHLAFARSDIRHSQDDLAIAAEFAERVSLALENARLHQTASRALAARDELLAFVTHDLRNFLTTIIFGAEVLAQSGSTGERRSGRRQVDAIRQAGIRMASVLDALRDAGMIEAGQFRVESRRDDLRALLAESVTMLQVRADARQVRLELRISGELPELSFDHERIHQVLANLVGNAIEHSSPGGLVLIEAAEPHEEGRVQITVRDEGPGIAPESMPHLFERYWRKDTTDRKGSGLGLFIAKGIIDAHEGTLSVDTEVGRGTTFTFTLPTARAGVDPSTGTGTETAAPKPGGVEERPIPKRSGAHAKFASAPSRGKGKLSG